MIGETVAHYLITGKLGEGGMGAVYRAEDQKLKRPVALKFLPPELAADPSARRQMLKEAQVASRLHHANIATIFEVQDHFDPPFIAMELVEGESLKDILSRGALPTNRMLDVARQLADGLEEAHGNGVLHRDLKPANVMVDDKGRVKILDFGLAVITGRERSADEAPDAFLTRSRTQWSTGGTVPYMPPEQLRGETTDVRGDVFSFGVLLYECLSGRYPFPGDTAIDMMTAIMRNPPAPLHLLVPGIDPVWETNIERCLAKDPNQRFQSIRELRDAFRKRETPAAEPQKSVAVLFFENLSGDKEDEYFRDGITEDIITELSNIKGLRVFPRSRMLPYRDKPVATSDVASELGAKYVLEGTVRRGGNRLRLTAQLVEMSSGLALWAERFDREMEDVFAIQDEIAQSIARALRVVLTEKEKRAIEKKQTHDVQAYDYYLRGRQFFHQLRRKGFDFARQMFARAIVIDPGYARAYAGVADCCSLLYAFWDSTEANLKEADAASKKALELDPELAEAHVSRGLAVSLSRNHEEAEREFELAIRLDEECFEAYYFYARACFTQGNLEKATSLYAKASQIRPEDYQSRILMGEIYNGMGHKVEGAKSLQDGLRAAEKHLELHPDDARALVLGAGALCHLGERSRSFEWAERALAIDSDEPTTLYNVACVYAQQGRHDDAIECLEGAVIRGFRQKAWFENDSDLDALRDSPRFVALLENLS
ncbi:MAG: protein kinase domain-containing protein [Planctomycetota bacterium]|jgi:non-specific serine/threonine protein kinase